MKKSDLKTGMLVTLRDGDKAIVLLGAVGSFQSGEKDILISKDIVSWYELKDYRENLTDEDNRAYDIMKIEHFDHYYGILGKGIYDEERITLWERESLELKEAKKQLERAKALMEDAKNKLEAIERERS